jgi:hypothetical protein
VTAAPLPADVLPLRVEPVPLLVPLPDDGDELEWLAPPLPEGAVDRLAGAAGVCTAGVLATGVVAAGAAARCWALGVVDVVRLVVTELAWRGADECDARARRVDPAPTVRFCTCPRLGSATVEVTASILTRLDAVTLVAGASRAGLWTVVLVFPRVAVPIANAAPNAAATVSAVPTGLENWRTASRRGVRFATPTRPPITGPTATASCAFVVGSPETRSYAGPGPRASPISTGVR